ncbi:DUF2971 domain-containing protein [Sphingomonas sp. FW199]|uniref:DUF2971 domain-containing protein n=1 Tax=Sphingomonas sp. FW199 TaxID=3400217 RepID=UPI003CE71937
MQAIEPLAKPIDDQAFLNVFASHMMDAIERLKGGSRLVHYTSAENAYKIISGKQVWLRNAHLMNDYSEMRHGLECLQAAWKSIAGESLQKWLKNNWQVIKTELEEYFNGHAKGMIDDTYIICLSEHDDEEDYYGRLSMWRAYGRRSGVALVLNTTAFLSETEQMAVYSMPVVYRDQQQFVEWFQIWVASIMDVGDLLSKVDRQLVLNLFFYAFRSFVLATKHPGFKEEREWRVFHSPSIDGSSPWLDISTEIVSGVPQRVVKLALKDDADAGVVGAAPDTLINRVIIGPCETPIPIQEALGHAMSVAGVQDAWAKMWMSFIPLRDTP